MPDLFAYTDGACSGNPGPGGWGVLMIARENGVVVKERELQGGEALTTNNRMELLAAISALEALTRPSELTIVTDSAYVKNGVTEWIPRLETQELAHRRGQPGEECRAVAKA
jgi:ribonuclease HI